MIVAVIPTGFLVTYGSNDQNNNDPRNQACYNAGFADGQPNQPYNRTTFNQCGINDRAYYEGFLSVAYQDKGKIILHTKS
jgi:hypothetical protein